MERRTVALIGLAAVAALAAGCGGGDGDTTTTVETVTVESGGDALTKAEWIAAADAICEKAQAADDGSFEDELNEIRDEPESADKRERLADLYDDRVEEQQPEFEELRALSPAPAEATVVNEILSAAEASLTSAGQLADAIERNDLGDVETISDQIKETNTRAQGMAKGYGLTVCGAGQD